MAELVPPIRGHFTTAVRERGEWRAALAGTRAAWENAYVGAPEVAPEVAPLELEELVG